MGIELYDTRTMMQAIERMKPARTFLRDTFFNRVETFVTENIDVDFKKGKRKMAPFVAPMVGGITMDRQGFSTRNYKVPKIAPQRIMTAEDIKSRSIGETIYSAKTPEQRAAEIFAKDLVELDEFITRREEWQCRELLLNGKITMKGLIDSTDNYTEQVVDYSFTNTVTLTDTDLWSADTADIHGDLKEWRLKIIKATGRAPKVVVMASGVVETFIKNSTIQKIYDTMRFNLGTIQPLIKDDAVTLVTYIADLDLQVYSYDEWFLDDDGTETAMLPAGTVIMGTPSMGKRLYGAITQIDGEGFVTYDAPRVPKNWVDVNNDIKMVRLSARPLPVPEDVDDWLVAAVL